jgi:hypothetical protein
MGRVGVAGGSLPAEGQDRRHRICAASSRPSSGGNRTEPNGSPCRPSSDPDGAPLRSSAVGPVPATRRAASENSITRQRATARLSASTGRGGRGAGIAIHSYQDLEGGFFGFNPLYNGRRQNILKGCSPYNARRKHLATVPALTDKRAKLPDSGALRRTSQVDPSAKEVSRRGSECRAFCAESVLAGLCGCLKSTRLPQPFIDWISAQLQDHALLTWNDYLTLRRASNP